MKRIGRLTHMIGCTSVLLLLVACATPAPTATPVPPTEPSATPALTETPVALASTKVPQTTSKGWATLAPTPTPAATPIYANKIEDLVGIWLMPNNWYVEYMPEGTWRIARSVGGLVPGAIHGAFWFDGTVYNERGGGCADVGQYEVRLVREGGETRALDWVRIKDMCTNRRGAYSGPSKRVVPATPAPAASLTIEKSDSITYATVDQEPTDLFIYAPSEPGPWPVVVVVPGAFQFRAEFEPLSRAITSEGAVVYNIDPDFRFPHLIGITRIACAVRFAQATAADYGGDPSRITLMGNAEGASTGAVAALAGDDFEGECVVTDASARVDALVGYEGPYDYVTTVYHSSMDHTILKETDPELWEAINPYSHLGRNPGLQIRLIHGDDFDSRWYDISPEVSVEFSQALADAGYDVELTVVEDATHVDLQIDRSRVFPLAVQQVMELARSSSP